MAGEERRQKLYFVRDTSPFVPVHTHRIRPGAVVRFDKKQWEVIRQEGDSVSLSRFDKHSNHITQEGVLISSVIRER